MDNKRRMKKSMRDRIFMSITYLFLTCIFVLSLYPVLFVLSASISDPKLVSGGKMLLWPMGITFDGYEHLLKYKDVWVGYANSIIYTFTGTILNLLVTMPAAYALSRKDMRGRGILMGIFVVTMYFSGGLIPGYLNIKSFGLLDTRMIMVILGLVSAYNMIVARSFFASTIPWELHEAAYLDGANDIKTFTKVVMPLSKPCIAVMALYYGEGHWNRYFEAMIYLRDKSKYPLQLILREILGQAQLAASSLMEGADAEAIKYLLSQQDLAKQLKYAVIVVATVPVLMIYPWLEKNFEKGMMIGSLKG